MHWKQLTPAIEPDEGFGWIWSGSAVVDWRNSSGFCSGDEDVLVAFYTAGGRYSQPSKLMVQLGLRDDWVCGS